MVHAAAEVAPAADNVPAGQFTHAPPDKYDPAGHTSGAHEPVVEQVHAAFEHVVCAATDVVCSDVLLTRTYSRIKMPSHIVLNEIGWLGVAKD